MAASSGWPLGAFLRPDIGQCPLPTVLVGTYGRARPPTELPMFGKKSRIAAILDHPLPTFDPARCSRSGCTGTLGEPRPFHIEAQGAVGVMTVHCLAKCQQCDAPHKGERRVALGKVLTVVDQSFHLYNDQDRALVNQLLPAYQTNAAKMAKVLNTVTR